MQGVQCSPCHLAVRCPPSLRLQQDPTSAKVRCSLTSVPLLHGCCFEHVRDGAVVEGSKEATSSVPASLREPGKERRARCPLASVGYGLFKFDAIFILGAVKPLPDVSGTVVLIGPYVRPFLLAIATTLPACAAPPLPFLVGHFPWREVSGGSAAVGVGSIRCHPPAESRAGPGSARRPLGAPRRSRGAGAGPRGRL